MRLPSQPHHDERGVALVVALLVLLVLSITGVLLMTNVSVNRGVAGHDLRISKALNVAEAGVGEAVSRIRSGDAALDLANPRSVAQIFLCVAGSVPVLGADSTGLPTAQPGGSWLRYSDATRGPDALTIEFRTDASRSVVYRYDPTKNPPVNTTTGFPIYRITATGRNGSARRTVVTEVIQRPWITNARAALAADQDIDFVGNAVVCGYNHNANTSAWDGENGRSGAPANKYCQDNEVGTGDLPGSWSTGAISGGGASYQTGVPSGREGGQTGFYEGPWDAFNVEQAEFLTWIGAPVATVPGNLHAILHIDNNTTLQDKSCNVAIHGGDGEGLLYVDGDLTLNSTFTYRGLIYVEGDLKMNGQAWVLGGLIVKGRSSIKQNGGSTILYSSDAISQALAKYGGTFVTLSWREVD